MGFCCRILILLLAVHLVLTAGLSGCRSGPTRRAQPDGSRFVTDDLGRQVSVVPEPRRLISLAPSVTEILFALGLGSRVVGVTTYCDYPPEATSVEKVGDTQRPSLERIVGLKPDLVIVSTASQLEEFVHKLDEMGIIVYVSNPRDLETLLSSIARIGAIAGVPDRTDKFVGSLRHRIEAVRRAVNGRQRPKVLFLIGTQPLITVGG